MGINRLRRVPEKDPRFAGFTFCNDIEKRYYAGFVYAQSKWDRFPNVSIRFFDKTDELAVVETRRWHSISGPADFIRVTPCGKDVAKAASVANTIEQELENANPKRIKFVFIRKNIEASLRAYYASRARQSQEREVQFEEGTRAASAAGFKLESRVKGLE